MPIMIYNVRTVLYIRSKVKLYEAISCIYLFIYLFSLIGSLLSIQCHIPFLHKESRTLILVFVQPQASFSPSRWLKQIESYQVKPSPLIFALLLP